MADNGKTILIKVGTSTLTHTTGKTNLRRMEELVCVLSDLRNAGHNVALVTSGAIGIGFGKLDLEARPKDTPARQAAATIGQCELMFMYDKMFSQYGHIVGQLLITRDDVVSEERRENLAPTFERLFGFGAIPIINENDAVAGAVSVYGDNDQLSAAVAVLIGADALIILTETDGLYTADPACDPNATRIPVVETLTEEIWGHVEDTTTKLGTGGMATKLKAAETCMKAGIDTYIICGKNPRDIYKILEGEDVGTHFMGGRKHA